MTVTARDVNKLDIDAAEKVTSDIGRVDNAKAFRTLVLAFAAHRKAAIEQCVKAVAAVQMTYEWGTDRPVIAVLADAVQAIRALTEGGDNE